MEFVKAQKADIFNIFGIGIPICKRTKGMDIDERIIKKATKCEKKFACLKNNTKHECCEIFMSFTNEICMIREAKRQVCK
jgi:hypothetical protein